MPDREPAPVPGMVLTGWQVVAIYGLTLACSTGCVLVPFLLISRSPTLAVAFTGSRPIYLRAVTVILVIWASSALAIQGRLSEGPAAIFGMIAGYVFGAVNPRSPLPGPKRPNPPA